MQAFDFGSVLLRHLLKRIVWKKNNEDPGEITLPILIIIDEVHHFYKSESSKMAMEDLDTICREGRSSKIGLIFSSQNQSDLPSGLANVINTKIYFKTDDISKSLFGVTPFEMQSLKSGYAVATIHDLSQLRIIKFPLSFAGVENKK